MLLLMLLMSMPARLLAQTCPPDRVFADGYDGVPVQRLHLEFVVQPSTTAVTATITPDVAVSAFDECDNPIFGLAVQIAIGQNPPNPAVLSGTSIVPINAAGIAAFSDLSLDYVGDAYTLEATIAGPGGRFSTTSSPFNETRVGDACAGPSPACASACADVDGDGLNDSWETAGGVDLNGDGLITAKYDTLLPGADPNKPDVYVQYDWMHAGLPDSSCSDDMSCSTLGFGHRGETCSGPPTPTTAASCVYACSVDADCTTGPQNICASNDDCSGRSYCNLTTNQCAVGSWHAGEQCVDNLCRHTHDPEVLVPGSLQRVVERFAAHGITLHVMRGHELPHSHVVSYRSLDTMTDSCEGGSVASAHAGPGEYAESLYDLKQTSDADRRNVAYHYALFAHNVGCDGVDEDPTRSTNHCSACPMALNPDGTPKNLPLAGESGLAEISGNDFVVSLGGPIGDKAFAPGPVLLASTFMHELGHNLGLHHGGGIDTPCKSNTDCSALGLNTSCVDNADGQGMACHTGEDDPAVPNNKPNFISIMNYRYQPNGISTAGAIGSSVRLSCARDADCPTGSFCFVNEFSSTNYCGRIDYSGAALPVGGPTPEILTQNFGLDEPAGLGSGTTDLFTFRDGMCDMNVTLAASQGPVDWNGDGDYTDVNVLADTTDNATVCNASPTFPPLAGHADWPDTSGIPFNYRFQCTSPSGPAGDGVRMNPGAFAQRWQHEWNADMAVREHFAYPVRSERMRVLPGASLKPYVADQQGSLRLALFGSADFRVAEVDRASLRFHGAHPTTDAIVDIDQDGFPDLVLEFAFGHLHLSNHATRVRLTGSLSSSQDFFAEGPLP